MMSDKLTLGLISIFILILLSVAASYKYGQYQFSKGRSAGMSQSTNEIKNRNEQNVNNQIKSAYISGCTSSTAELLALHNISINSNDYDLTLACAEDANKWLPWYNID